MKRPRILVDIDGVFADFVTPCLDAVRTCTGRSFDLDEVREWDTMKSLGISPEDARTIYESMERPGLCLSLPAYEGAREGVESLRTWADVWAITSPFGGAHWMHERDAWLVEKMGFDKRDILHVRGERKHGVVGDVLVEDKTSTLRAWTAAHPTGTGVLFLRSYNRNDGWEGSTAQDWPSLVETLEILCRR